MSFFSKAAAAVAGFAAGASVADKIQGIVSETQQAFNKLKFGDVSGAASAAGFLPTTKFGSNDFPNSPSSLAARLSRASIEPPQQFGILQFPPDIGKYHIRFAFTQYQKEAALKLATDEPTVTVVFPIPATLNENFSVSYNDAKLGPVMGAIGEAVTSAITTGSEEGVMAGLGKLKEKTDLKALGIGGGIVMARAGAEKLGGEALVANIDKATGVVPNPHLAAIFQDIGLREHSFNFRFSPRNKQEADTLKKIIRTIKRRMLPGTANSGEADTGPLFSFPDVVDISFSPSEDIPYKIKRSVLTSMTVNYAPNGTPSFNKDGSPTDIEIGLQFKEVRVVTRNDYPDQ